MCILAQCMKASKKITPLDARDLRAIPNYAKKNIKKFPLLLDKPFLPCYIIYTFKQQPQQERLPMYPIIKSTIQKFIDSKQQSTMVAFGQHTYRLSYDPSTRTITLLDHPTWDYLEEFSTTVAAHCIATFIVKRK